MAYSKQTWVRGEKVASTKLNHMEDGIDAISANGAIDTANLANASVTNAKLDQEAVDTDNIRNGAITTPLIYDGAVTRAKIADAALADIAAEYSSSKTYAVGDYVFHSGALYRCTTAITTAEAWTAAHWTRVALADDVADLKSALNDVKVETPFTFSYWQSGYINRTNGTIGSDPQYCVTSIIKSNGYEYVVRVAEGYEVSVGHYGSDGGATWLGKLWTPAVEGEKSFRIPKDDYFRVQINKISGNLSPESINDSIYEGWYNCYTDETLTLSGKPADAKTVGDIVTNHTNEINILKTLVPFEYDLDWTISKYIISGNGTVGTDGSMACTLDYYPVKQGQQLQINLYAKGDNECAVAFYNESKVYDSTKYVTSDGEKIITVPFDGFARFSTKVAYISTTDAYVKNYVSSGDDEQAGFANKKYYIKDFDQFITGETVKEFTASSPRIEGTYKGEVNPNKRYLAIGFDDFRASDFNMMIPLFEKYGGRATFNRPITSNDDLSKTAKNYLDSVIFGNHEVGDHTIKHMAFPYEDALFNGQNPSSPDGSQTPYPTNEQMRGTNGATVNAFYSAVTAKVSTIGLNGLDSTIANTAWKDLTDAQCQTIRETFSAMKNPTLAPILDELSNYYLGTTGTSAGSWDSGTGKYTGGIFTGCATSANHEIWERILTIVQMYYKEKCGLNGDLKCWSWPGEYYFGRGFSSNGYTKYYFADMTELYNMNARFESSLYKDELGNAKVRSFTDVLREFGYKYTHDYIYPSRLDYQATPAMRKQFYFNEHLSKEDGVLYPTDRTITYSAVNTSYPSTFFTTGKTKAAQMYDSDGVFYNFIEALRHDTAHGLIHGEVIDSTDSYSMKIFFEEALRFCKSAGIEVITKAEAYDICFNHPVENGNLIYNPTFRNSAAEFFTDATNVPTNPDGYSGSCSVATDASGNILVTAGETVYIHYGVPLGKIKYSADAKGTGTITIYLIKCGDNENLSSLTQLAQISVDSASDFVEKTASAVVPNNAMTTWSQRLEGRNNKVMGLKIVYSTGLQIKNIRLVKE